MLLGSGLLFFGFGRLGDFELVMKLVAMSKCHACHTWYLGNVIPAEA